MYFINDMHKYITSSIADFFNSYQRLVIYVFVIQTFKSAVEIY